MGWMVLVVATQAWPSWQRGIRELFAADVTSYERIAIAAPGLPSSPLAAQHAQRFPVHWVVGTVSHITGANLHEVYRVASVLCLLATVLVMQRVFVALGLGLGPYALCIGVVVASAFPMRYLLAAPGMLSDAVFLLGLAMVMLGFAEHRDFLVVLGVAVAATGRQTAVPLAVVVAVALLISRRPHAVRAASLALLAGVGVFFVESIVARGFTTPDSGGVLGPTLLGSLDHPVRLLTQEGIANSDARAFLALLVPLGLIAGAWLRGHRPPAIPVLLAASVIVQPLLLSPTSIGHNATRLAALAIPALAFVAACQLREVNPSRPTIWISCAAIFAASLHARYSDAGIPDAAVWAAIDVIAAVSIVAALGWPRLRRDLTAPIGSERSQA